MLSIDSYGLDVHLGQFSLYINNPSDDDPGSFSLHLPLLFWGVIVIGWEKSIGWDFYRITATDAELLEWIAHNFHDGVNPWEGIEAEPTDADLATLEAAMSLDKLTGDN